MRKFVAEVLERLRGLIRCAPRGEAKGCSQMVGLGGELVILDGSRLAAIAHRMKLLVPSSGRRNANWVTPDATADMGGGATFYDVRVEVERADADFRA